MQIFFCFANKISCMPSNKIKKKKNVFNKNIEKKNNINKNRIRKSMPS